MASVQVFGLPLYTNVSRVLTCLFEKDVKFQLIRVDSYKDDHKVPEFLKLQNVCEQVTLKDGKDTFTDSREICRHICEKHAEKGNKRLLGAGALERSMVEKWLHAEAHNFDPPSSTLIFYQGVVVKKPGYEQLIHESRTTLERVLNVYDERLAESRYLAGDEFTLADLSHLPNSHYLMTETETGKELFSTRKNLTRWWESIKELKSWMKVVQLQNEHPKLLDKFNVYDYQQNNHNGGDESDGEVEIHRVNY